jgi:hypothetical protein
MVGLVDGTRRCASYEIFRLELCHGRPLPMKGMSIKRLTNGFPRFQLWRIPGLKKIRIGQLGDRSKLAPAVESRAK